jgi:hypothetical protein
MAVFTVSRIRSELKWLWRCKDVVVESALPGIPGDSLVNCMNIVWKMSLDVGLGGLSILETYSVCDPSDG